MFDLNDFPIQILWVSTWTFMISGKSSIVKEKSKMSEEMNKISMNFHEVPVFQWICNEYPNECSENVMCLDFLNEYLKKVQWMSDCLMNVQWIANRFPSNVRAQVMVCVDFQWISSDSAWISNECLFRF